MTGGDVRREDILTKLRETLVSAFDLREDQIIPSARLVADLELDSLDLVDLVVRLEQEANVEIEEDELKAISTVGDVVDVVHRKLNAPAP